MSALERMREAVAENQRRQNRPLGDRTGQLDLGGNVDTTARYDDCTGERLKLFEPAPEQMAGQTQLAIEREDDER